MNERQRLAFFEALRRDAVANIRPLRDLNRLKQLVAQAAATSTDDGRDDSALHFDRSCGVVLSKAIELFLYDLVSNSVVLKKLENNENIFATNSDNNNDGCDDDDDDDDDDDANGARGAANDMLEPRYVRQMFRRSYFDFLQDIGSQNDADSTNNNDNNNKSANADDDVSSARQPESVLSTKTLRDAFLVDADLKHVGRLTIHFENLADSPGLSVRGQLQLTLPLKCIRSNNSSTTTTTSTAEEVLTISGTFARGTLTSSFASFEIDVMKSHSSSLTRAAGADNEPSLQRMNGVLAFNRYKPSELTGVTTVSAFHHGDTADDKPRPSQCKKKKNLCFCSRHVCVTKFLRLRVQLHCTIVRL
jgi:hypothetical protein